MPIDRKRYEPITGNPRRKTKHSAPNKDVTEAPEGEEVPGPASPGGGHAGPSGTPTGPARPPSDPERAPTDAHQTPSGRTRRVKVTPQDWAELEAIAERLGGLPYAKVYNMAFQALQEKLG